MGLRLTCRHRHPVFSTSCVCLTSRMGFPPRSRSRLREQSARATPGAAAAAAEVAAAAAQKEEAAAASKDCILRVRTRLARFRRLGASAVFATLGDGEQGAAGRVSFDRVLALVMRHMRFALPPTVQAPAATAGDAVDVVPVEHLEELRKELEALQTALDDTQMRFEDTATTMLAMDGSLNVWLDRVRLVARMHYQRVSTYLQGMCEEQVALARLCMTDSAYMATQLRNTVRQQRLILRCAACALTALTNVQCIPPNVEMVFARTKRFNAKSHPVLVQLRERERIQDERAGEIDYGSSSAGSFAGFSANDTAHQGAEDAGEAVGGTDMSRRGQRGPGRRPASRLPESATAIMHAWAMKHLTRPHPSEDVMRDLAQRGGISTKQVRIWFANFRQRKYYPFLAQVNQVTAQQNELLRQPTTSVSQSSSSSSSSSNGDGGGGGRCRSRGTSHSSYTRASHGVAGVMPFGAQPHQVLALPALAEAGSYAASSSASALAARLSSAPTRAAAGSAAADGTSAHDLAASTMSTTAQSTLPATALPGAHSRGRNRRSALAVLAQHESVSRQLLTAPTDTNAFLNALRDMPPHLLTMLAPDGMSSSFPSTAPLLQQEELGQVESAPATSTATKGAPNRNQARDGRLPDLVAAACAVSAKADALSGSTPEPRHGRHRRARSYRGKQEEDVEEEEEEE